MLSKDENSLLRRAVEEYAPALVGLTFRDVINLPLDQRNRLRSALGDYLSAVGFDEELVPTRLGLEIERLIDLLGPK